MSALIRPRGPLPRRVYWIRRMLVVLVVLALVLLVAQLVGDDDAGAGGATGVAARVASGDPAPGPTAGSGAPSESSTRSPMSTAKAPSKDSGESTAPKPSPTKRPLPKPDGPCEPADVLVTPTASGARPDGSVDVTLSFSTLEAAACTFEASAQSVFLTISSGERTVWASQHCGSTVPSKQVVPRRTKPAELVVRWNGRESAVGCPETEWVESGDYTVAALARGSVNIRKSTFTVKGSS